MAEPFRPTGGFCPLDGAGSTGKPFDAPPARSQDEALLESVLRRTLLQDPDGEGEVDEKERAALWQVAARHRGRSLAEPPVLVELVEAALEHQFPPSATNAEFLRGLSRPIAESFREDPWAWKRLQSFWARLCEVVP